MPEIELVIDGVKQSVATGTTGTTWYESRKDVVAIMVDGTPTDLDSAFQADCEVTAITLDSPEGLDILRHSTTHVLAQAVQDMFPDVNLGIGPFITDGFYYDFGNIDAVTPELLRELEKRMKRIVKEGQRFRRRTITEEEARVELAEQPYKLELVTTKGKGAEGANVEVSAGGLTMYDNVRRDGSVAWKDLCRGPHLPSTRLIGNGFALTKSSSAYWKGDQSGDSLQRIYGTAWASKDDLKAYQDRMAEAAKREAAERRAEERRRHREEQRKAQQLQAQEAAEREANVAARKRALQAAKAEKAERAAAAERNKLAQLEKAEKAVAERKALKAKEEAAAKHKAAAEKAKETVTASASEPKERIRVDASKYEKIETANKKASAVREAEAKVAKAKTEPAAKTEKTAAAERSSEKAKTKTADAKSGKKAAIQAGYAEKERALSLQRKMKAAGIDSTITEVMTDKGKVYRVKSGAYKNAYDAERDLNKLRVHGIAGQVTNE